MKVTVNEKLTYEVAQTNGQFILNDNPVDLDVTQLHNHAHVLYNNRSYQVEIVFKDNECKTSTIKVNGHIYTVAISDEYDALLKQLGMDSIQTNRIADIKAPMPGLILKILVEEGQPVAKGDSILVLEAMKMENMIKSPSDGTIKKVLVATGDKIEKNELLIQFA